MHVDKSTPDVSSARSTAGCINLAETIKRHSALPDRFLKIQTRLPPQQLALRPTWPRWMMCPAPLSEPRRLCTTMVFFSIVASDCCAGPAFTVAAKHVIDG